MSEWLSTQPCYHKVEHLGLSVCGPTFNSQNGKESQSTQLRFRVSVSEEVSIVWYTILHFSLWISQNQ